MKKFYLILAVGSLMFGACQKEELPEDSSVIIEGVSESVQESTEQAGEEEEGPAEYFKAKINGDLFEVEDPQLIKGTVYPSRNTGVINFDFSADGVDTSGEENVNMGFLFKVCFYDGPNTYYTGTTETVSWAMYWTDYGFWENHYAYGNEPGIVIVTNATDTFVEGTFEFEAYSSDTETTIEVEGEFGIRLESEEDYNS
ncbi:hypothetical protein FHG64_11525 [Antarcticibacterium flavum]|uniref:Uncharacterized protein n=1 Tax=Antarcticibacterium flavum TaxID=2058175 RepID=A0A5B7X3M4_9FLAO|nr:MULTISPECIES: hypothetical protein [Antarcticibacterium]MCM4161538.1 hypothetical protein [Antarcticibacterium sp. W02-3]QCY69977.1 hypothetical protein FHG64_11525 [Antarcticibacterium flavum]